MPGAYLKDAPPIGASARAYQAYVDRELTKIAQTFEIVRETYAPTFEAQGTDSGNIANLERVLTWGAPAGSVPGVQLNADNVEALERVTLLVFLQCMQDATGRAELQVRQYRDTGGGYAEDTTKRFSNYTSRTSTTQDEGGVSPTFRVELEAGDKVQYRAFCVADAGSVLMTNGTTLIVMRANND